MAEITPNVETDRTRVFIEWRNIGTGSWTTTSTRVLLAGLQISAMDDGAGGAGGFVGSGLIRGALG